MHPVGGHRAGQPGLQYGHRLVDQLLACLPGQGATGHPDDDGPLQGALGMDGDVGQMAGLPRQVGGQFAALGVRGDRGHAAGGAGQVEHPPLQHLITPGEAVPAPEDPLPVEDQPQGGARTGLLLGDQIVQPAHAVQGDGESAVGAGLVEGIAAGPDAHPRAGQVEDALQQPAALGVVDRPPVARIGGKAIDRRTAEHHPVQRIAEPLLLALAAGGAGQALQGGQNRSGNVAAGRFHGPAVSPSGRRCWRRRRPARP